MKYLFLILLILFFIPTRAFGFGSVNPAVINQYRYYQTTPSWNRNSRVQHPRIYSEQQARYYGYRTLNNNTYNRINKQMYGSYYSGFGYK